MNPIKFYRVETLPEIGEVGSLYFVYKDEGPKLYVSTSDGFEQYSQIYSSITNEEIDTLFVRDNQIVTYGDVTVNTDLIL